MTTQTIERFERKKSALTSIPPEIVTYASTLRILDLSGNPQLASLPSSVSSLVNLKIAFFSDCGFTVFPPELSKCPSLSMVAFRGNGMNNVPEDSLPPNLRWLILTNNNLTSLPKSIGKCSKLEKCMLAGNSLTDLPVEMSNCSKLGLLRISANKFNSLPGWLLDMPELAFLAFSGNPGSNIVNPQSLEEVPWADLIVGKVLGEGASGIISQATWKRSNTMEEQQVAIKLFKGTVTSDGLPSDEMAACISAERHPNLVTSIGSIVGHPENVKGLVLPLIPPTYKNLGLTPSFESCTRDVYPEGMKLGFDQVLRTLEDVASASVHLHERGISHGDLYAHNILVDQSGSAVFGDFGAAYVYGTQSLVREKWEKLEVLAFGHLIEDMLGVLVDDVSINSVFKLKELHRKCSSRIVTERPLFAKVLEALEEARKY